MADPAIEQHVPLGRLTTLGIGGAARWYTVALQPSHVAEAVSWASARQTPHFVLGGGSNVVVSDDGFPGLVTRIDLRGVDIQPSRDGSRVTVAAGEPWDDVVAAVVGQSLSGVECLSGIPGTAGGTPVQNVGAYGQEVADVIESVDVFDTLSGVRRTLSAVDCRFTYRHSVFKEQPDRYVVLGTTFLLRQGPPAVRYPDLARWLEDRQIASPTLADVRAAVLAVRRRKGMVLDAADPDSRSAGSFFMNPVVGPEAVAAITAVVGERPPTFPFGQDAKIPAAWLIERAGLTKGHVDGRVGLSTKHPLAIVNRGGATARDVLRLATTIKRQVAERFGVMLRPEPVFVGFSDDPDVRYLQRAT